MPACTHMHVAEVPRKTFHPPREVAERAAMSNNSLAFVDSVICYKEQIDKEETSKRNWKARYGTQDQGWRPVEPFERTGASSAKTEMVPGMPAAALRTPSQFRDTVGGDCLAGGTPLRFGGKWDVLSKNLPDKDDDPKPQRVVKKGPHDCYCEVGYNCWSMAGKARTANFGLMGVFEREFWSNTPGELALVWDIKGEGAHVDPKAKAAALEAAKKKAEAAARVN